MKWYSVELRSEFTEGDGKSSYSIPSQERKDHNADMENPTKGNSPCFATNASVVRDDGLIQRLRAYRNSENNDAKVKSKKGNPVQSVASKQCNGIQLSCNMTSQKGKGIIPSPEVNDLMHLLYIADL